MIKIYKSSLTKFVYVGDAVSGPAEDFELIVENNMFHVYRPISNFYVIKNLTYDQLLDKDGNSFNSFLEAKDYLELHFKNDNYLTINDVGQQFIVDGLVSDELKLIDITFLGLNQTEWQFSRGARTERDYIDSLNNLRIRDRFINSVSNDGRVITPSSRIIEWIDTSGNVKLSSEKPLVYSKKNLKNIHRDIRQGQIDYLETGAENLREVATLVPEPTKSQYLAIADSIDLLFEHYSSEVSKYIDRGTDHFEQAVLNESDQQILGILALPARQPDSDFPNGLTVKQSIIYQLTGVKP